MANDGFVKWIPNFYGDGTGKVFYIRRTPGRTAYQIGYGPAHLPEIPVTILMPPFGASGAADKIWKHAPGVGWTGITPPKAGWYWWGIWASPFNPNAWLLLGNNVSTTSEPNIGAGYIISGGNVLSNDGSASPLWITTDGGANWSQVTLSAGGETAIYAGICVAWSDSDAGLYFVTAWLDTFFAGRGGFWRGTGNSTSPTVTLFTAATGGIFSLTSGSDGDCCLQYGESFVGNHFGYVARGSSTLVAVGSVGGEIVALDRLPFSSKAVVGALGTLTPKDDLYVTGDYITTVPALAIADLGTSVTAAVDGIYIGRSSVGVLKVSDVLTSPSYAVEPGTSGAVGMVRASRRTRSVIAARIGTTVDLWVKADGAWSRLAGPTAAIAANLADVVEVIG